MDRYADSKFKRARKSAYHLLDRKPRLGSASDRLNRETDCIPIVSSNERVSPAVTRRENRDRYLLRNEENIFEAFSGWLRIASFARQAAFENRSGEQTAPLIICREIGAQTSRARIHLKCPCRFIEIRYRHGNSLIGNENYISYNYVHAATRARWVLSAFSETSGACS